MKWLSQYNTGIKDIDNQHKRLINIINRLEESMIIGQANHQLGESIKFLVQYTRHHFTEEEAFMLLIGYPEINLQKNLHQQFITDIKQILIRIKNKEQIEPKEIVEFLTEWMKNHILVEDLKIGQYVTSLKTKGDEIKKEYSISVEKELLTRLNHFKRNHAHKTIDKKEYLRKKSFIILDYFDSQQVESKEDLNKQFDLLDDLAEKELILPKENKAFQLDLLGMVNFDKIIDNIGTSVDQLEYLNALTSRHIITKEQFDMYKKQIIDNM